MNYKKIKYMLLLGLMLIILGGCEQEQEEYARNQSEEASSISLESSQELEPDTIFVYISGQVRKPGVYEMKKGSRIFEVINAAGGTTDQAELSKVNQAALVQDQDMILVPRIGEAVAELQEDKGLININKAGIEVLSTLPGIGLSKAQSIISYREKNGPFKTIEDIQKIEGIKSGVFNKIKDSITV